MKCTIYSLFIFSMIFLFGCTSNARSNLTVVDNNKIVLGCIGPDLPQGSYLYRVELYPDDTIKIISSDDILDRSYNISNSFNSALAAVQSNIENAPFEYLGSDGAYGGHEYVNFTVLREDKTVEIVNFEALHYPDKKRELALSNWTKKVFFDFSQRLPKVGRELSEKCHISI